MMLCNPFHICYTCLFLRFTSCECIDRDCEACLIEKARRDRTEEEIEEYANQVNKGIIEPGQWL